MRNRWGVEVRKGDIVRFHLVRGGVDEDRVFKVVRDSDPWVQMDSGRTCSLDDVVMNLGPSKANPTPRLKRADQESQRAHIGKNGRPTKRATARLKERRSRTHYEPTPGVWANPLVNVKVKSPAQRGKAAPSERLRNRRKTTEKAPAGFYANPFVKGESNANAARYAELYGGAPGTIRAWKDHYIVRFHKPGEKIWTPIAVFKMKSTAVTFAKEHARLHPTYTVSIIDAE